MLTDTAVRKATVGDRPYNLTDRDGLFLWVNTTGGKLWRWKYRFDRVQKQMAFGKYPDVSLAQARELHAAARRLLASGVDPMAQRKAEKCTAQENAGNSFQTIANLWLAHWREGKSPRHADYTERRLQADVFPCLGARPIAEIEAPELVAMCQAIQDRGALDIAKRALETTGQIFRYAVAHGHAKRNPAADIRPSDILKPRKKVNMARVDAKELPQLLTAIEVYRGTPVTRLAMKLIALTFVRTSELIGAKWAEFDLENARWDIPAERMKMRTPHIVPLSQQAVEVLNMLKGITGDFKFLFPGDRKLDKPMSNNTILQALRNL